MPEQEVLKFDPSNDDSTVPEFPLSLTNPSSTDYKGALIVCGGYDEKLKAFSKKCFQYKANNDEWIRMADLNKGKGKKIQ